MASHQSLKKSDLFTVGNLISLIIKGLPPPILMMLWPAKNELQS